MKLSEETIKQIFFLSDKPRVNPIIADDVDIVQFAENVAAFALAEKTYKPLTKREMQNILDKYGHSAVRAVDAVNKKLATKNS